MFWKELRASTGLKQRQSSRNSITAEEWEDHFQQVFCLPEEYRDFSGSRRKTSLHFSQLDDEISEVEVKSDIQKLKRGKSPVIDQIIPEMLKIGQ